MCQVMKLCFRQVVSGWEVLRWFLGLVLKRFPCVSSWLNDCVEPDKFMPAVGRHILRMRSR